MTFTDAHSPSGLHTHALWGDYRPFLLAIFIKRGVLGGYSAPLIADRPTVGNIMQLAGYHTAAIGKWHLGMNMTRRAGGKPAKDNWDGDGNVISPSQLPIARSRAVLMNTLAWRLARYGAVCGIENDRFVPAKLVQQAGIIFPASCGRGRARVEIRGRP